MIQVQAPNGDIVQFPDGTPDDVMVSAMRKKYGGGVKGDPSRWNAQGDAVDMLTMGLGNKAVAGGQALYDAAVGNGTLSESYDARLAQLRANQEAWGAENPVAKRVGQGTGLALGVMAGPAVSMFKGATMLPRIANAALTGGAYGTVAGAAEDADSLGERATNAAKGAGFGAAFGAAAYPVAALAGKGVNKTWQFLKDYFTKSAPTGAEKTALETVLKQLQASGMTPREAWVKLQTLGPESAIADVAPNLAAKTAQEAIKTPEAVNMVTTRLGDRLKGGHTRMENALDTAFGPKVDPYTIKQSARAAQATTGNVYKSAEGYEVDTAPVADFVQKEILKVGPRGPWGASLQQIRSLIVDDAGNLISNGARVHAIREQLDIMAEGARNSGQGKLAGKIGEVRKLVDSSLKKGIPGFAEADAKFAGEARKIERFEQGRRATLTNKMTPEEIASIVDNPDVPIIEKQMLAQGARWNIAEGMSNSRNNPGFAIDRITTRNMNQPKIEKLTGSPQAAQKLSNAIERENTFTETANIAIPSRNSATALRQAEAMQSGPQNPSIMKDMGTGAFLASPGGLYASAAGAGAGLMRNIVVRVQNAMEGKANPEVVKKTVDMLTNLNPAIQKSVLDSLEAQLARLPQRAAAEKTIARLVQAAITQAGARYAPDVPVPALAH